MLRRERANKGTKRMNSFPFSPLVISFILRDIYWENCCLQILCDTVALNSYLGLSALGKKIFCLYKIWIMCILCTPRPICRPTYRPTVDRCIGRHIGRVSVDMSVDISVDSRSICRPTLDRYVGRYVDRE